MRDMTSSIRSPSRRKAVLAAALAAAALGGCTTSPQPAPVPGAPAAGAPAGSGPARYRCDHGLAFTVQHGDDSVTIDAGPRGRQTLWRDAGGVTPQQTVYSNERLKAEFGLGPAGQEALLRYAEPPLVARCVRE